MHIDIENAVNQRESFYAGFLSNFPDGCSEYVFPVVHMAARLEPGPQLGMVDQEQTSFRAVDHKCACGDMTGDEVIGRKCFGTVLNEIEDGCNVGGFVFGRVVSSE